MIIDYNIKITTDNAINLRVMLLTLYVLNLKFKIKISYIVFEIKNLYGFYSKNIQNNTKKTYNKDINKNLILL